MLFIYQHYVGLLHRYYGNPECPTASEVTVKDMGKSAVAPFTNMV